MHNIKLLIAYEGTHYLGWQKTKMGSSIEETLETILSQILQHPVQLQAASRTDAGVHADGQVVNFFTSKENLDLQRLQKSLNGLLPPDISVTHLEFMPENFHPTLSCSGKEYHYEMCNAPFQLPFHRPFSWHFPSALDLNLMQQAASHFLGEHDFSTFCNERSTYSKDTTRELYQCEIHSLENNRLCVKISGNHFLYKMVRNIVGTLVYVGCGKIPLASLSSILQSGDRTLAGVTAPAHGLRLKKVFYDLSQ